MDHRQKKERGISLLGFLITFLGIFILLYFLITLKRWEGTSPAVEFDKNFKALGRNPALTLNIEDQGNGLNQVSVVLKQKDQVISLVDEHYPGPSVFTIWRTGHQKQLTIDLGKLLTEKYKVQQGPASLTVLASDHSFRNFFRGNQTQLQKDFEFDIYPPKLEVLSGQHYINQGGSECVVYRVSPDAILSGVQAGPNFFPGFSLAGADPNVRFALFAYAYYLPDNAPLKVIARDEAGNEAVATFWNKIFPKKFKKSDIPLEDDFLQRVVPEIMSHTPDVKDQGDLLKTFVQINSQLRKINHDQIRTFCQKSPPRFLWDGAFLQLPNSQVEALFADHRTYFYQGKEVDQQDHVGFDLSVTQQNPIEASNDGVVVYADYFGIYGNTVLIDHGCGLLSLYGHMSSFNVKVGDQVKKKQIIGKSGATGLAKGDHLHFGLFLQGVPVNATEWWDAKWIKDHVLDRLKDLSSSPPNNG